MIAAKQRGLTVYAAVGPRCFFVQMSWVRIAAKPLDTAVSARL
ncbi:hypothetical protein GGR36_000327 [Niveibacterium umoris]|uniref:Uncharacterized protein n=1 Tax=Niveibacterium umoris TaxID=1193620 RepID=A0A840BHC6_9RHOO|nr:hypothetical protein [Niveibacterium umoris]